jgi:alkylation response protein AidB-like acyl-CoA dehydrogenase
LVDQDLPLARRMRELVESGRRLPLPASGATLDRWRVLAEVAAEDLALVKLFEGHTDALAICAELGAAVDSGQIWATWAAEPPFAKVRLTTESRGTTVTGRKAWCSGCTIADAAVMTAWDADDRQCLVTVALRHPRVRVMDEGWAAVGMGRAFSGDVIFEDVPVERVGGPGDYIGRPGFWQGAGGIAACWYGGSLPLAAEVVASCQRRPDPHKLAHLGAIDAILRSARAALTEAAAWIDAHPTESAKPWALRVRAAAESTALEVHQRAGRALGAGPLCRDPVIAQHYADLPVFVRQSHAESDLAELGTQVIDDAAGAKEWSL